MYWSAHTHTRAHTFCVCKCVSLVRLLGHFLSLSSFLLLPWYSFAFLFQHSTYMFIFTWAISPWAHTHMYKRVPRSTVCVMANVCVKRMYTIVYSIACPNVPFKITHNKRIYKFCSIPSSIDNNITNIQMMFVYIQYLFVRATLQ